MRLGFLDVASNKFNGFEVAARECEQQANVELVKLTAPEHLKIPVCAKKLFVEQGADVVLAFVQANFDEDRDILMLVQEKTIDVEVDCNRLVFFCVILDDEWRTADELARVAEQKIAAAVLEIVSTFHAPEIQQPPEISAALGMFAQPSEESGGGGWSGETPAEETGLEELEHVEEESAGKAEEEASVHQLF